MFYKSQRPNKRNDFYMLYTGNNNDVIAAGDPIVFSTKVFDFQNLWDGTTLTCRKSGLYVIVGRMEKSGTGTIYLLKNSGNVQLATPNSPLFSGEFELECGETATVAIPDGATTLTDSSTGHHVSIFLVSDS